MNAVQKINEEPVVAADANSIMAVIARAANDPNTDVDKLERLLGLYERITAQNAKAAYMSALAQMQPKLPVITERGAILNKAGEVQSRYAKWEDINEAIKPILMRHGFALSFRTGQEASGVAVTGVLSHRDGHSEQTTLTLPIDASGSKNNVQGVGSSVSYGKRYTAQALLNLTSRGEDDDGLAAGAPNYITDIQMDDLVALMDEVKADRQKFLDYLKIDTLAHLPAKRLNAAIAALEAKRKTT